MHDPLAWTEGKAPNAVIHESLDEETSVRLDYSPTSLRPPGLIVG